jgi:hypothetical protein
MQVDQAIATRPRLSRVGADQHRLVREMPSSFAALWQKAAAIDPTLMLGYGDRTGHRDTLGRECLPPIGIAHLEKTLCSL